MSALFSRSKLPAVGTTIFTVMSKLASDHGAVNLSQGFPDYPCAEELTALVTKYVSGGFNQYAPMPGLPVLRERISEKMLAAYGRKYNADSEVTVTAGATQAIFTAISAIVHQGDEAIIFEPAYDCYAPAIELYGGKVVPVKLEFPAYSIDWKKVESLITERTRAIIINNPNNPCSSVLTREDLAQLDRLTKNTDVIIISDEVYEHLVFDGAEHLSVAKYPTLAERSFIVYSFGKTYHSTGWKIGYCVAPAELMTEFRKVHQFNVFCVNHPMQQAIAEYMKDPSAYLSLPRFFEQKRDFFLEQVKGSRFTVLPARGTYFQLLGYEKISDEPDTAFAERMTKEFKLASIPLSVFYSGKEDNRVLRFCFAKKEETLERAGEVLRRI